MGHSGIVDQYGHRTKLRLGLLDHHLDSAKVRNVRTGRYSAAAFAPNFGRDLLGRIRARRIVDAHGGAPLRQKKRDTSADAARAARNHRHLVTPCHCCLPACLLARLRKFLGISAATNAAASRSDPFRRSGTHREHVATRPSSCPLKVENLPLRELPMAQRTLMISSTYSESDPIPVIGIP
jgi:hypothetical protein